MIHFKAIPTKLVLQLKSDGTVEKCTVRWVALGLLQHAGQQYHLDVYYSPMNDPNTVRTLAAISNALGRRPPSLAQRRQAP